MARVRRMQSRLVENTQRLQVTVSGKNRSASHSQPRHQSNPNDTSAVFAAVNRTMPTTSLPTDRLDLDQR